MMLPSERQLLERLRADIDHLIRIGDYALTERMDDRDIARHIKELGPRLRQRRAAITIHLNYSESEAA